MHFDFLCAVLTVLTSTVKNNNDDINIYYGKSNLCKSLGKGQHSVLPFFNRDKILKYIGRPEILSKYEKPVKSQEYKLSRFGLNQIRTSRV